MRYADIKGNDIVNGEGICVSFWAQGCPHHCPKCFNPETWDFDGGKEFSYETLEQIINGLTANGVKRSLCILGGEPLCDENEFLTNLVIRSVKQKLPEVKVYIWTGYTYEELVKKNSPKVNQILHMSDYLIDGPYVESLKDITLQMRGSSNQRIINLREIDKD